jgi:ATP-dependent Clp protease adaptor protein ClpS
MRCHEIIGPPPRSMLGLGVGSRASRLDGRIEMLKTVSGPLFPNQNLHRAEPENGPGVNYDGQDKVRLKRPSMWNLILYDDDTTPMDFVEFVLMSIFHMPTLDALALTLAVRTKGRGIAGTYTFEVAEQKQSETLLLAKIEEHPLRIELERV